MRDIGADRALRLSSGPGTHGWGPCVWLSSGCQFDPGCSRAFFALDETAVVRQVEDRSVPLEAGLRPAELAGAMFSTDDPHLGGAGGYWLAVFDVRVLKFRGVEFGPR
ncbi:hypothetical protein GCM10009812_09220 [Nocardioides marinus]